MIMSVNVGKDFSIVIVRMSLIWVSMVEIASTLSIIYLSAYMPQDLVRYPLCNIFCYCVKTVLVHSIIICCMLMHLLLYRSFRCSRKSICLCRRGSGCSSVHHSTGCGNYCFGGCYSEEENNKRVRYEEILFSTIIKMASIKLCRQSPCINPV